MIRARQGVRVPNKSTGVGGEAAIQADETRTEVSQHKLADMVGMGEQSFD